MRPGKAQWVFSQPTQRGELPAPKAPMDVLNLLLKKNRPRVGTRIQVPLNQLQEKVLGACSVKRSVHHANAVEREHLHHLRQPNPSASNRNY